MNERHKDTMTDHKYSVTLRSEGDVTTRCDDDELFYALVEAIICHSPCFLGSAAEFLAESLSFFDDQEEVWNDHETVGPKIAEMISAAKEVVEEIRRARGHDS